MSSTVQIDSRGYGKIYKLVMRDKELPLLAKAIYAYFCAYAGSGTIAFPKRDKITRDLGINKDTYTKHLGKLVEDGYICKERSATGNIYTIVQTVSCYKSPAAETDEAATDLLIMESVQAQGFGTVPKLVVLDRRLSAQAKAIYAYFASFAGAGTTAFPRRTTVMRELGMTGKTYYKHLGQLMDAGYLSVEQQKINGRFDVSIYRLADTVERAQLPRGGESSFMRSEKATKAMSEKLPNGDNDAEMWDSGVDACCRNGMSEILPHGGKLQNTTEAMSDKGMSEKLPSGKFPREKPGQPNIKNSSITNSFLEKEQDHNHQGCSVVEGKRPRPAFSLIDAKQVIGYDDLLDNALAFAELKELLGHFSSSGDKERYKGKVREILSVLLDVAHKHLNNADQPDRVITALQDEAFTEMTEELLNRWDKIRSVRRYVARSLGNSLHV